MFRATWLTAAIAGAITVVSGQIDSRMGLNFCVTAITFYTSFILGIVGVPQLREAYREMRRRGSWTLLETGDLQQFYFPVWRRMLIWFVSCGVTALVCNVLGL